MGYLGNAPADQAVQIGTGVVGTSEIEDDSVAAADIAAGAIFAEMVLLGTIPNTISSDTTISHSANFSIREVTISGANTDVTVSSSSTWTIS